MSVDYNKIATKFTHSRKGLQWEEIYFFFSHLSGAEKIIDIACGSGRFLDHFQNYFKHLPREYLGVDMSENLLLEARKNFPDMKFLQSEMQKSKTYTSLDFTPNVIFCIAGFHHLEDFSQRQATLAYWYNLLPQDGFVYMTNWALSSPLNSKKYEKYSISECDSQFGSSDYFIPFGEYKRYYHDFSLAEISYLASEAGFKIQENFLFHTQKNIVTILQK